MIDGYKPAPVNEGVFAAIAASTTPYPMLPYHGLLHTALGDNIAEPDRQRKRTRHCLT